MHVVRDSIETRVTHAWDKLKGKDQVLSENSTTCNTGCYTNIDIGALVWPLLDVN